MALFYIILFCVVLAIIIFNTPQLKGTKPATQKKIVKTEIIGGSSRKSATSSITRGVVGGAMFGAAGLVGGALSGKNKDSTTFLIFYDDGTKATTTAKNGGLIYNKLIQYIE